MKKLNHSDQMESIVPYFGGQKEHDPILDDEPPKEEQNKRNDKWKNNLTDDYDSELSHNNDQQE